MDRTTIKKLIADYWFGKEQLKPVQNLALNVMWEVQRMRGYTPEYDCGVDGLVIGEKYITYSWEEYHSGDTDHNEVSFPTSYLWAENYKELELAQLEKEKQERIEEGRKQEKEKKERDRLYKMELYHKLQLELGIKETI